jgi:hypothetical protein
VTTALLLDEAQQLPEEALEGVRLLSNLDSDGEKALQIILAGQPELHTNLDRPLAYTGSGAATGRRSSPTSLAPLKQRIAFWGRMDRLKHGEIAAYIEYRLRVAGYPGPALLSWKPSAFTPVVCPGSSTSSVRTLSSRHTVPANDWSRRTLSSRPPGLCTSGQRSTSRRPSRTFQTHPRRAPPLPFQSRSDTTDRPCDPVENSTRLS